MATPLFDLRTEQLDEANVLVHCTVSEWSPSVARELDEAVARLMDQLLGAGVTRMFTLSPNPRFCEYMGGDRIGTINYDDTEYGVYQWELK